MNPDPKTPATADRRQRARRCGRAAAAAAVTGLLLAACGNDPDPVTPVTPSASQSSSGTATAEPTPTPSVSLPLSALEDDPAVTALRGYLTGYALAVNNGGDVQIPEVTRYATPDLVGRMPGLIADEKGLQYAGPVPFTPVALQTDTAERKDVAMCMYSGGYAVDPATDAPREPLEMKPVVAVVDNVSGAWLVRGIYNDAPQLPDCSAVTVQEVPF